MIIPHTTLFVGLTREVTFAGLPLLYLVVLIGAVMLGFILTSSFYVLIGLAGTGYLVLRALATYDPKIIAVMVATLKSTRMNAHLFTEEGVFYRA